MNTLAPSGQAVLRADGLGRRVPAKVLVEDARFEVLPGETLAIVGPSGSGKTSLLRLLNRLDEPTSGTMYLDGVDYRQIPPRQLRRRVGMVLQRPYLFPGTVAGNLRFGPRERGEELSDSQAEELLARVGLAGYGSRDPANLSGGEAQRVSFARTLANSPEVLLLDEPTSALDAQAEYDLFERLRSLTRGRTAVYISHRFSTVRRADRIVFLEQGRLVEEGTHAELMRLNGRYARLFRMQASAYTGEDIEALVGDVG